MQHQSEVSKQQQVMGNMMSPMMSPMGGLPGMGAPGVSVGQHPGPAFSPAAQQPHPGLPFPVSPAAQVAPPVLLHPHGAPQQPPQPQGGAPSLEERVRQQEQQLQLLQQQLAQAQAQAQQPAPAAAAPVAASPGAQPAPQAAALPATSDLASLRALQEERFKKKKAAEGQ